MTLSKITLRATYRQIRRDIPLTYRADAAKKAGQLFRANVLMEQSEHIACYLPFQDEFDPMPLIEAIWQVKKKCYLPVLNKDEKSLRFVQYDYGDALHLNQFSILEPIEHSECILPKRLDLVITPLIAFDRAGHRLGTGGGYYDRTFSFLNDKVDQLPCLIGLAYAAQEANCLPADSWDIALQAVITEKAVISCR